MRIPTQNTSIRLFTGLILVLFAIAVFFADLPFWDEANGLLLGRSLLKNFSAENLHASMSSGPLYCLVLAVIGKITPTYAISVHATHVLWSILFSIAFAGAAYGIFRNFPLAIALGCFAIITRGSFYAFGTHRAAATLVLCAFAAGVFIKRRWLAWTVYTVVSLLVTMVRQDAILGCILCVPAVAACNPAFVLRRRYANLIAWGCFSLLMLLTTQVSTDRSHSRLFFAFSQHYAVQQHFLAGFGLSNSTISADFQPWFDFSTLIARDFPGADSFSSALMTSPTYAVGYLTLNWLKAFFMAWIGLGFGALKTIPIPIVITAAALLFSSRRFRHPPDTDALPHEGAMNPKALYLTCLGFYAVSASSILIWSISRHVIGITMALILLLTWVFMSRAKESVWKKAPVAIMLIATVSASAMLGYRVLKVHQRPNLQLIEHMNAAVGESPVSIAGQLSDSVCAYLDTGGCHPVYSRPESPCGWFELGADYIVERAGVLDSVACTEQAKAYERLSWSKLYDVRRKMNVRQASVSKHVPTPAPHGS